jgi:cyclopropane-fatty-acyl-phospholipid synthase
MQEYMIGSEQGWAGRALGAVLSRIVRRGSLEVGTPSGAKMTFGDGTEPDVAVHFADERAIWALIVDPELQLGDLFTSGRLVIERGSVYDLIDVLARGAEGARFVVPFNPLKSFRRLRWRLTDDNSAERAKRNAAHHYDLESRIYGLFLDEDRQYSCAYFERPDQSLDDAQAAKKRHIAAKLRIQPGHRVLDIGSGWGGLALSLARIARTADVVGITLSEEQLAYARDRAERLGLSRRVRFELQDYRSVEGTFDRIVSVGMFEHVGRRSYEAFFRKCHERLADDGVMLLHTIGRTGEPYWPNPWVTRHIFPGGYIPTLSEIAPALERSGLMLADLEVLRLHYAWTLRAWRTRFLDRRDEARQIYGERFCRMWEFYLASSEVAFRNEDLVVFQFQLVKRNDVLPVRRDYIGHDETALREREHAPPAGQPAGVREAAGR